MSHFYGKIFNFSSRVKILRTLFWLPKLKFKYWTDSKQYALGIWLVGNVLSSVITECTSHAVRWQKLDLKIRGTEMSCLISVVFLWNFILQKLFFFSKSLSRAVTALNFLRRDKAYAVIYPPNLLCQWVSRIHGWHSKVQFRYLYQSQIFFSKTETFFFQNFWKFSHFSNLTANLVLGALLWWKKYPLLLVTTFFFWNAVLLSVPISAKSISQFGYRS